ncbi:uncharacterized protein LOC142975942 [Anticarsia gemmatalis]|uniref:uncharacterized protein LOC142975942 n=1 Tax=Anticarsia gemmatalis TaxID=129554 RepID=UPI003F759394
MTAKFLILFVVAAAVAPGFAGVPASRNLVEITLADQYHTFITNPLIAKTIGIPKSFLDTLESCHILYPDNQLYEAFPLNRLPEGPVTFLEAVQPFTSCAVGFLGASVSMSGTYQLVSTVRHNAENYSSRTMQRFHLTFVQSELWPKEA